MTYEEYINGLEEIEKPLIETFKKVIESVNPKRVLEVGSGWGLFSRAVMEYSKAELITIDKIPVDILKDYNARTAGFEGRITRLVGDSKLIVPTLEGSWDLMYIDGDHTYEGFKGDLELCWGRAPVILLDDIFHRHNFDTQYGITRALWEKLRTTQASMIVYPVAHGVGRLDL